MNADTTPPILVNEKTACELLGRVTPRTLFNLRQRGLPYVKLGSRVMYCLEDLRAWVEKRKAEKGGTP